MIRPDDRLLPIRSKRRKGSRKTGKVPWSDIQRVLLELEKEAGMTAKEKRTVALSLLPPDAETRTKQGFANRCNVRASVGDWRLLLAIALPLYTGYRSSDCYRLRWDDLLSINMDGRIEVRKTLLTKEKKTSKRREIPINDDLAMYIIKAYQELKPRLMDNYVFVPKWTRSSYERHITRRGYYKLIAETFDRFGVYERDGHVSPHCLRKSYAFAMFQHFGGDYFALLQVQKLLNHSSLEDTITYLDVTLERNTQAHAELSFRSQSAGPAVRALRIS